MRILIIDGQGGKIGRSIAEAVLKELPGVEVDLIGTNAIATANMLKSGAKNAATGENPVVRDGAAGRCDHRPGRDCGR